MITSQQVNQMHMSSMQSHGMAQGMMPSQPMMGMSQYPPTFSYSMAGQQNPNERIGRRAAGAMVGATQGALGVAGAANMGLGLAGMFGLAATTGPIGIAGGLMVGAGIMGAQATVGAAARGMQYGGQVNQIFGNQQFANAANPMGRGFNSGQLQQMYGAVRAIEKDDPFVNMKDALRVTEKFGSQFGIQQGIRDAEKLSSRVTELGKTLAKMAKTMGTTIDEAGDIMGMSKSAGFYTAQDVMGNTQNFMFNRGRGFTSQQTGQIQGAGAAASRSMGLTGQSGAMFSTRMVQDLSLMGEMGTLDQNALMDMTGAIDPNSASMAFAGRTQQIFQSTMGSPIGNALMGALGKRDKSGNFTGEIDHALLRDMNAGNVDFNAVRSQGQQNIRGGSAGSFMENKDQILGNMMESGDGLQALINVIEQTAEKQGKSSQLIFEQITGGNAKEFRMLKEVAAKVEATRAERQKSMHLEAQMQMQQTHLRENATIGGITKGYFGGIQDKYISPIEDFGAQGAANMGSLGESLRQGSLRLMGAGTASFSTSSGQISGARALVEQVADATDATGNVDYAALERAGITRERADLVTGPSLGAGNTDPIAMAALQGRTGDLRTGLAGKLRQATSKQGHVYGSLTGGALRANIDNMSPAAKSRLRSKIAEAVQETNPERKAELLQEARREAASAMVDPDDALNGRAGSVHEDQNDLYDAVIAEVGGSVGVQAVQGGRQGSKETALGKSKHYDQTVKTQDELLELYGLETTEARAARFAKVGGVVGLVTAGTAAIPAAIGGGLLGGLTSDGIGDLAATGAGFELLGKATSGGEMYKIDAAIANAKGDDTEAAKKLSAVLKMTVTANDVKVYRKAMDDQTGTETLQRAMAGEEDIRAGRSLESYDGYGKAFANNKEANMSTEKLALNKLVEITKASSTKMISDLKDAGITGLDGALSTLESAENLGDHAKGLEGVLKAAADATLTMDSVGAGAGLEAQLVAQASEQIQDVRAMGDASGQVDIEALKKKLNIAEGSEEAERLNSMAGAGSTVSLEAAEELAVKIGSRNITQLADEGAVAMTTALQSGMSPMEIQLRSSKESAESVRKNAEMIDAIYARMTNSPPAVPDSAVAANAGWVVGPGEGGGSWE